MPRSLVILLTLIFSYSGVVAATTPGRSGRNWPAYSGTNASTKYSPLPQINARNVQRLKIAWRWKSADLAILKTDPELHTWKFESTPIMVGGTLYTSTSLSQVAAIDAATGRTIWVFDPHTYAHGMPPNFGFVNRGVAYWSDGNESRIFIGTGDGYLIALDAKTGKPAREFGDNGKIDLTEGLLRPVNRAFYGVNSPPVICSNTVIVGSAVIDYPAVKGMPRGDVRGFDVRTGKLRWTFHTIPLPGEFGYRTWGPQSWKDFGAANVWPPMSADDQLGYVYLPISSPSSDFYGGARPGNNLFSDSLVCLNAASGKLVWYFQMVHHDLWDRDPPAAPILTNIRVHGHLVRAVAQVTKQGFVYVFNRVSGKPLWPIHEEPVPRSAVPGEWTSATQPIPTRPAPFDQQGLSTDDLIDFTPKLRREAEAILSRYDHGPLFTPPSTRGTILMPGVRGGASWSGAAFDPESGMLYIPSITDERVIKLVDTRGKQSLNHPFPQRYRAFEAELSGPEGLPLTKPPYGRVTAIDLKTGETVWTAPMGDGPRNSPALRGLKLGRLGWPYWGHPLLTKTLLLIAQEGGTGKRHSPTDDPNIQVFDKRSGKLIAEVPLPSFASGSPMTYLDRGRQYIVVAIGGGNIPAELVALSLPESERISRQGFAP
ncbi:MAG TPA: pyrroloquinoline quinone-dependent dehydrogenase [Bryobacteraceae bacterium]